jgi:hypothetical protein
MNGSNSAPTIVSAMTLSHLRNHFSRPIAVTDCAPTRPWPSRRE